MNYSNKRNRETRPSQNESVHLIINNNSVNRGKETFFFIAYLLLFDINYKRSNILTPWACAEG